MWCEVDAEHEELELDAEVEIGRHQVEREVRFDRLESLVQTYWNRASEETTLWRETKATQAIRIIL